MEYEAIFDGLAERPRINIETSSLSTIGSVLACSDRLTLVNRHEVETEERLKLLSVLNWASSLPAMPQGHHHAFELAADTDPAAVPEPAPVLCKPSPRAGLMGPLASPYRLQRKSETPLSEFELGVSQAERLYIDFPNSRVPRAPTATTPLPLTGPSGILCARP